MPRFPMRVSTDLPDLGPQWTEPPGLPHVAPGRHGRSENLGRMWHGEDPTGHGRVSELSGGVGDGLVEYRQAERKLVLGGGQWRGDPENAAHAGQLHDVNVQA